MLLPRDKYKGTVKPDLDPRNHYHHFLDAILGKTKNESYFEQTGPMTEAILLGGIATRFPKEELQWDAEKLAFNNKNATALVRREYRKGWEVKGL